MANCVVSYIQYIRKTLRKGCISVYRTAKDVYLPFITSKMKYINFKSECIVWVAMHLKGDWFIVLH